MIASLRRYLRPAPSLLTGGSGLTPQEVALLQGPTAPEVEVRTEEVVREVEVEGPGREEVLDLLAPLVAPLIVSLAHLGQDVDPLFDLNPVEALHAAVMAVHDMAHGVEEVVLPGGTAELPEFAARVKEALGREGAWSREEAKASHEEAYSDARDRSREKGWPADWAAGNEVPQEWIADLLRRGQTGEAYRWLLTAKVTLPGYVKAQRHLIDLLRIAPDEREGLDLGLTQHEHSMVVQRYNRDQKARAGGEKFAAG